MNQAVSVELLGELGKEFGRKHKLFVGSPAEAVRALCANFEGFERFVASSHERNVGYRVLVGKTPIHDESEIHHPSGRQTIKIVPVIAGAGGGGLGSFLLGAALIAVSFYLPTTALFTLGSFAPSIASITFGVGFSLALGGVVQMLSPTPTANDYTERERPEDRPSAYFQGAVNTSAQGQPVPIGYGRMTIGSAVISAAIDVAQVEYPPNAPTNVGGYLTPDGYGTYTLVLSWNNAGSFPFAASYDVYYKRWYEGGYTYAGNQTAESINIGGLNNTDYDVIIRSVSQSGIRGGDGYVRASQYYEYYGE